MNLLLTVGTSRFPFRRFFEYVTNLLPNIVCSGDTIYIQYGFNSPITLNLEGVNIESFKFVSVEAFSDIVSSCNQVITHGAAGTIMQCCQAGIRPLVLCRDANFGEHSDNHQVFSSKVFADMDLCRLSKLDLLEDINFLTGCNFVQPMRLSGKSVSNYLDFL